ISAEVSQQALGVLLSKQGLLDKGSEGGTGKAKHREQLNGHDIAGRIKIHHTHIGCFFRAAPRCVSKTNIGRIRLCIILESHRRVPRLMTVQKNSYGVCMRYYGYSIMAAIARTMASIVADAMSPSLRTKRCRSIPRNCKVSTADTLVRPL